MEMDCLPFLSWGCWRNPSSAGMAKDCDEDKKGEVDRKRRFVVEWHGMIVP